MGTRRPQDAAAARQRLALRRVRENQDRIENYAGLVHRAVRAMRQWQRRANHYAERAAMTDEQVDAERQARLQRPRNRKRAISVKEDV